VLEAEDKTAAFKVAETRTGVYPAWQVIEVRELLVVIQELT